MLRKTFLKKGISALSNVPKRTKIVHSSPIPQTIIGSGFRLFKSSSHVSDKTTLVSEHGQKILLPKIPSSTLSQDISYPLLSPKPPEDFSLPTLEKLIQLVKKLPDPPNFKDIILVSEQHLLSTTISFIKFLLSLNAEPQNIFIMGKRYSTNEDVMNELKKLGVYVQPHSEQLTLGGFNTAYNADANSLWEVCYARMLDKKEKKELVGGMIVLGHGGGVITALPAKVKNFKNALEVPAFKIIYTEQTSSGMTSTEVLPYPTIEVATSAIKRWVEPSQVAVKCVEEIKNSLERLFLKFPHLSFPKEPVIGMVGLGHIGRAMLEQFINLNYRHFIAFDRDGEKTKLLKTDLKNRPIHFVGVENLVNLYHGADIIIGNTGEDHLANQLDVFATIRSPKILFSTSSKDTEFRSLLLHIQKNNRNGSITSLEDIAYKNGFGSEIVIARGGTPIGFTNGRDSVAPRNIEVIRGLKAAGALQAYHMLMTGYKTVDNYKLDARWQRFIVSTWLDSNPPSGYSQKLLEKLNDLNEIAAGSGGVVYEMKGQHPLDVINKEEPASSLKIR